MTFENSKHNSIMTHTFYDTGIIVLAAGKGTRMKSDLPKVLHPIQGKSMLAHVLDAARAVVNDRIYVVVGHKAEMVKNDVSGEFNVHFALQEQLIGTGDAVKSALSVVPSHIDTLLVLYGDIPLISENTLVDLVHTHKTGHYEATIITIDLQTPFGYGRIVKDDDGFICRVVEEPDATFQEKEITLVNSGIYCFQKEMLAFSLDRIKCHNTQQEFYLTDVFEVMHSSGARIGDMQIKNTHEVLGVNTIEDLKAAQVLMDSRGAG